MKKVWIILAVVVVVVGGFLLLRNFNAQRQLNAAMEDLQTEQAALGDLVATVGATGTVRSNQTAQLSWQTSGTVGAVNVEEGEVVAEQQVLAALAQASLSQSVILAQADLVNAQQALEDLYDSFEELALAQAAQRVADLEKDVLNAEWRLWSLKGTAKQVDIDQAEATLVLAQDKLEKAQEDFNRYESQPEDDPTRAFFLSKLAQAQKEYDDAERRLNNLLAATSPEDIAIAEADLALLQAQLADAQAEHQRLLDGPEPDDIAAAQARIDAAQATLDLAYIKAPFSGTVTAAEPKIGDQVSPGTLAFRVDDLSRLLVDVEVSEVDINRIEVGQPVVLSFDAILAQEYQGEVVQVALVGTSQQGVVNFIVTVELLDADESVRPGMTAAVNIVVSQLEEVLLVPNRAVRVLDGERVVYILTSAGSLEAVPITLGASSDTHSQMLDGDLRAGDTIVLNPPLVFETDSPPSFIGVR